MIDKANEKYFTLYSFQNELIRKVEQGNPLTIPSGRSFDFEMKLGSMGDWYWNIRDIVNWPNQGYAADLMVIARISLWKRLKQLEAYETKEVLLINTVHDDIQLDIANDPELCYTISKMCLDVFKDIPKNFEKLYGRKFRVPMAAEVSFGPNLADLKEFKPEEGVKQFT